MLGELTLVTDGGAWKDGRTGKSNARIYFNLTFKSWQLLALTLRKQIHQFVI